MSEFALRVEGLSKLYNIGAKKQNSIKDSIAGLVNRKSQDDSTKFWALKDISFEVKRGEVLGVIGRNGAGKSTLLKVLSRITEPTKGKIEISGRVSSLLEVGTGFHPELSGRENIFLNGTILGMKRGEVRSKFDEIVDFSGIEKFIDTPVKHYSSGMYVRLAFAVAAHLEPEILIIDEVLAVGDASFQKKCLGKMKDVASHGRTVLFVSHQLGMVRELCTQGILLKNGELDEKDTISNVIEKYNLSFRESKISKNAVFFERSMELKAQILEAKLTNSKDEIAGEVDVFEDLYFHSVYEIRERVEGLAYNIVVERNGNPLFLTFDTDTKGELLDRSPGVYKTSFKLPSPLKAGLYNLKFSLGVLRQTAVHGPPEAFVFTVEELSFNESMKSYGSSRIGIMATAINWKVEKLNTL